jgi:hypothetical protein
VCSLLGCCRVVGKEKIPTSSAFQRQSFMCGLPGRSREPLVMRTPHNEEVWLVLSGVRPIAAAGVQ